MSVGNYILISEEDEDRFQQKLEEVVGLCFVPLPETFQTCCCEAAVGRVRAMVINYSILCEFKPED